MERRELRLHRGSKRERRLIAEGSAEQREIRLSRRRERDRACCQ